jgi:hypothetical protein
MAEPRHSVVGPMLDAERVVLREPYVKCGFTYGVDRPRSGKPQTRMKRCFTYRNNDCICSFNHAPHECDHERQWQGAATGCRSLICLICARCVLMASCRDRPHDLNIGCSSAKVDAMFNLDVQPRAIADRRGVPIRHAYLQGEPLTMAASVNTLAISRSLPFNLS